MLWQVPFDAMAGAMPQPGCLSEPWNGEAEVHETLADGTPGSTWMLRFDGGQASQFCTGNVSVIKDGLGVAPLQSLAF